MVQLMGYDIEKPDVLQQTDHIKLETSEFNISFPVIDVLRCRYCGSCIKFCPETALHFDRSIPRIRVIPDRCIACGECIKGCHVSYIEGKQRLCGYIIQGCKDGNYYTFGKSDNGHDYHLPLICELNKKVKPGVTAFCDLPPGNSGFVRLALDNSSVSAIIVKPNRGWKRNVQHIIEMLTDLKTPFGIVINKIKNEESFVREVQDFCELENIPLFGKIPHDIQLEQRKTSIDKDFGDDLKSIFAEILMKIQQAAG